MTDQNSEDVFNNITTSVAPDAEPETIGGLTREEYAALTDEEKEAFFVKQAVEQGSTPEDAAAVYKIITQLSPPITVENVEALGLPLGQSQVRVGREYDSTLADRHLAGYTDIIIQTPLGPIIFSIDKETLIAALTVEVPHVSPQKAPVDA